MSEPPEPQADPPKKKKGRVYKIIGISMHPEMIAAVKAEVEAMGHNNVSEYVRTLIAHDLGKKGDSAA